jgi:ElaB/YqjD/DUF883 family membrane-anchored ribosome-binding protein
MSDDVEIEWRTDRHSTFCYRTPPGLPPVENALAEQVRQYSRQADKEYDGLREKLDNSLTISKKKLEKILALMNEVEGEEIVLKFGDDKPLYLEQKSKDGIGVQAAIAPRIDADKAGEMTEKEKENPENEEVS